MDFIDSKATAKHGTQIPTQKNGTRRRANPMQRHPWLLTLRPCSLILTHFIDDESDQVEQIPLTQVTADSRGLAIATLSDALPYLREQESISTDALGLLITEEVPSHLKAQAKVTSINFPATYLPTQDPLLVNGCLLQLGDHEISRQQVQDPATSQYGFGGHECAEDPTLP